MLRPSAWVGTGLWDEEPRGERYADASCGAGAMILGSTLALEAGVPNPMSFMFFPLVVHAMDIVVSSAGILYVGFSGHQHHKDPMTILKGGYFITAVSLGLPHPWQSDALCLRRRSLPWPPPFGGESLYAPHSPNLLCHNRWAPSSAS